MDPSNGRCVLCKDANSQLICEPKKFASKFWWTCCHFATAPICLAISLRGFRYHIVSFFCSNYSECIHFNFKCMPFFSSAFFFRSPVVLCRLFWLAPVFIGNLPLVIDFCSCCFNIDALHTVAFMFEFGRSNGERTLVADSEKRMAIGSGMQTYKLGFKTCALVSLGFVIFTQTSIIILWQWRAYHSICFRSRRRAQR